MNSTFFDLFRKVQEDDIRVFQNCTSRTHFQAIYTLYLTLRLNKENVLIAAFWLRIYVARWPKTLKYTEMKGEVVHQISNKLISFNLHNVHKQHGLQLYVSTCIKVIFKGKNVIGLLPK